MISQHALAQSLYEAMSELWIIDAHNHVPPETERLALEVDAVSLFENYPSMDLAAAGMSEPEYSTMIDRDVPLEKRWKILEKYLPAIRNTSLTRSTLLGIRELYGFDDITADNYRAVSERMQAENKPGIYRRIFRDHGRILLALNQDFIPIWRLPEKGSFRIPQMWEIQYNVAFGAERPLKRIEDDLGCSAESFDEYLEAVAELMAYYQKRGVVGIKLDKPTILSDPQKSEVSPLFDRVIKFRSPEPVNDCRMSAFEAWRKEAAGKGRTAVPEIPLTPEEKSALRDYIAHSIIRTAGELGLVVIQHASMLGTGGDFRRTRATDLIPVISKYPQTKFEIYHLGMPWPREIGMMAKAFPNVWLNLCWASSVSPRMTRSALSEWLDLVPVNKIIAFGADTYLWTEWVLGDLIQTREVLSSVLAERIGEGLSNEQQVLEQARMMLYETPKNLYGLDCSPGDDSLYV